MKWCHLKCYQCHMTLTQAPVVWHDKKSCCTSFQSSWSNECIIDIEDSVIIVDADISTNGIPLLEKWCCISFSCFNLTNAMVPFMILCASCESTLVQVACMTKKSCCTSFWLSGANKCNCAIYNAIGITLLYLRHIYVFDSIRNASHCVDNLYCQRLYICQRCM